MVGSQIVIAKVLADLNLAVRYGIAIHIYASKKFWWILIWRLLEQTAKPPNLIPATFSGYTVYYWDIIRLYTISYTVHTSSTKASITLELIPPENARRA